MRFRCISNKHIEHPTEFNRDIVGPSVIIFAFGAGAFSASIHALALLNVVYIFNGLLLSSGSIRSGSCSWCEWMSGWMFSFSGSVQILHLLMSWFLVNEILFFSCEMLRAICTGASLALPFIQSIVLETFDVYICVVVTALTTVNAANYWMPFESHWNIIFSWFRVLRAVAFSEHMYSCVMNSNPKRIIWIERRGMVCAPTAYGFETTQHWMIKRMIWNILNWQVQLFYGNNLTAK